VQVRIYQYPRIEIRYPLIFDSIPQNRAFVFLLSELNNSYVYWSKQKRKKENKPKAKEEN
jgi:hypothetical protein